MQERSRDTDISMIATFEWPIDMYNVTILDANGYFVSQTRSIELWCVPTRVKFTLSQ